MNKEEQNNQDSNEITSSDKSVDEAVDGVKQLPPKEQEQAMAKLEMTMLEMHSGPIPHPDILEKYYRLDPGAAKLIIENGVKESEHRRNLENEAVRYTARDTARRDWMGFIIGIIIISVGALLIYTGHTITGTVLSGVSAIGLVGLFVGDKSDENNDKKK